MNDKTLRSRLESIDKTTAGTEKMLQVFAQARIAREKLEAQTFADWLRKANRRSLGRHLLKWGIVLALAALLAVSFA